MNLSRNMKFTKVWGEEAAAVGSVFTTTVDMTGFEGVVFLASIGVAANNNGLKVQQGQQSNMSDGAELLNTQVLSNGVQTDFVLDINRPLERYVRAVVVRGTLTAIDAVWAIQYGADRKPVQNTTTTQAWEIHATPTEGAA